MAEIRQKIVSCPQGHYYDANRYSNCPICSSGGFAATQDPFSSAPAQSDAGSFPPTTPPEVKDSGVVNMGFGPTEPPRHVAGVSNDRMGHTQYVDSSTPVGAPAPVVGWLVAVAGPCRGTDYRIHTGYNYIGRESGDICIHGDNTISAEKDANITYVPQTRKFYIAHELGKNVLLVNNRPAIGSGLELENYDMITIGTTKLIFMALCSERFSWEDEV